MERIARIFVSCVGKCCDKDPPEEIGETRIKTVVLCCASVEKGVQIEIVDGEEEESKDKT